MDQPAACEELVGLPQVHSALGSRAEMEQGRWMGGGGGGGGGGVMKGRIDGRMQGLMNGYEVVAGMMDS